jgi:hypothetical protein
VVITICCVWTNDKWLYYKHVGRDCAIKREQCGKNGQHWESRGKTIDCVWCALALSLCVCVSWLLVYTYSSPSFRRLLVCCCIKEPSAHIYSWCYIPANCMQIHLLLVISFFLSFLLTYQADYTRLDWPSSKWIENRSHVWGQEPHVYTSSSTM